MKILATVFTYPPNVSYFKHCIEYLEQSCCVAGHKVDLLIVDFGEEEPPEDAYGFQCMTLWKPMAGFGSNFNSALSIALTRKYDYLLNINDDAFISEQFIAEGVSFLEANPNAGMVAGIPNQGGWLLELEDLEIPEPVQNIVDVKPLERLWWETSACLYRAEALRQVGMWDTNFDLGLSVCSDNDYYLRMQMAGCDLYRNGAMRFFHIKGLTQAAFGRKPSKEGDAFKQRNLEYFYQKWNVRLEQDKTFDHAYKVPFGGIRV